MDRDSGVMNQKCRKVKIDSAKCGNIALGRLQDKSFGLEQRLLGTNLH